MAIRIAQLDPPSRKTQYPWHEWITGDTWQLEAGVDYKVSTRSMQSSVIATAKKRNIGVTTRIKRDKSLPGQPERWIQFQFSPDETYGARKRGPNRSDPAT